MNYNELKDMVDYVKYAAKEILLSIGFNDNFTVERYLEELQYDVMAQEFPRGLIQARELFDYLELKNVGIRSISNCIQESFSAFEYFGETYLVSYMVSVDLHGECKRLLPSLRLVDVYEEDLSDVYSTGRGF